MTAGFRVTSPTATVLDKLSAGLGVTLDRTVTVGGVTFEAGTTLDTVLAGLDVLTATKVKLRGSPHVQVLLEVAVVRLARMDLAELQGLPLPSQ